MTNADCDDGLYCTQDICDTEISSDTVNCTITYGNIDGFGDTQTITAGYDTLTTNNGAQQLDLVVIDAGSSDCANAGGVFAPPCTVPAGTSVVFESSYVLQAGDTLGQGALPDTAHFSYNDNCDDPETTGCTTLPLQVEPGAATIVVPACENPPVVCDDPEDFCTDPVCLEEAQGCTDVPANVGVQCGEGDFCTNILCADDGTCTDEVADNVGQQCDEGDFCNNVLCADDGTCSDVVPDNGGEVCGGNDDQCLLAVCEGTTCSGTAPDPEQIGQICDEGDFCNNILCADDGTCTDEVADNVGVVCDEGEECYDIVCADDGTCSDQSNEDFGTPCTDDGLDDCVDPVCDGEGVCDQEAGDVVACADPTCQACDPADGQCKDIAEEDLPPDDVAICYPEGCFPHTRGFWTEHAIETDYVSGLEGGLSTCGEAISTECPPAKGSRWKGLAGNLQAQCIAATLNFAVAENYEGECSGQLGDSTRYCVGGDKDGQQCGYEEDGYCASEEYPGAYCGPVQVSGEDILAYCCGEYVCSGEVMPDTSLCVDLLSSFNESEDTLGGVDLCVDSGNKDDGDCAAEGDVCLVD